MRKTRQELEHPKPYVTPHGIYQLNPQTGTYEFQAIPQTLKDPANVARLKYILNLLQSDNPGEQELNRSARHWYTDTNAQAPVLGCSGRHVYESHAL